MPSSLDGHPLQLITEINDGPFSFPSQRFVQISWYSPANLGGSLVGRMNLTVLYSLQGYTYQHSNQLPCNPITELQSSRMIIPSMILDDPMLKPRKM